VTWLRHALAVVAAVAVAATAHAQESLQAAKDLYASAAYEDALAALGRVQRGDSVVEVQQYRAFCLIALGRLGEAQKAIAEVVTASPAYIPSATDTSPRIQEFFTRTRNQLLPEIARQKYSAAKRALDRKDREAAASGFAEVVALIDGAEPEARDALDELRFLAAGFFDLSTAASVPETKPPAPSTGATVARPAAPPADLTPPVAIRQTMPRWVPVDRASQRVFTGAIRVLISATGQVESAEIIRPTHPAYDRALREAAKGWEYQPARRGGVAMPSEQVVEVQLKPNQ